VAARLHAEIHEAVLGPGFQHVTEERNGRAYLGRADAVDVELESDLCLLRLPLDAPLPALALATHRAAPPVFGLTRTSAAIPCPARPSIRVKARRCAHAAGRPPSAYSTTLLPATKSSVPTREAEP